jgi:cell fate (sporulation/competence/biofilm development) regulator YlbF (YheA/YmcA/DUF963 family)
MIPAVYGKRIKEANKELEADDIQTERLSHFLAFQASHKNCM